VTRFQLPRRKASDLTAEELDAELDATHAAELEKLIAGHAARKRAAAETELDAAEVSEQAEEQ
jgi:hypothetical protein